MSAPFRELPAGSTVCAYCHQVAPRASCDLAPRGDRCARCTIAAEIAGHDARSISHDVSAAAPDTASHQILAFGAFVLFLLVAVVALAQHVVYVDVWLYLAIMLGIGVAGRLRARARARPRADA